MRVHIRSELLATFFYKLKYFALNALEISLVRSIAFSDSSTVNVPVPQLGVMRARSIINERLMPLLTRYSIPDSIFSISAFAVALLTAGEVGTMPQARMPPLLKNKSISRQYMSSFSMYSKASKLMMSTVVSMSIAQSVLAQQ